MITNACIRVTTCMATSDINASRVGFITQSSSAKLKCSWAAVVQSAVEAAEGSQYATQKPLWGDHWAARGRGNEQLASTGGCWGAGSAPVHRQHCL